MAHFQSNDFIFNCSILGWAHDWCKNPLHATQNWWWKGMCVLVLVSIFRNEHIDAHLIHNLYELLLLQKHLNKMIIQLFNNPTTGIDFCSSERILGQGWTKCSNTSQNNTGMDKILSKFVWWICTPSLDWRCTMFCCIHYPGNIRRRTCRWQRKTLYIANTPNLFPVPVFPLTSFPSSHPFFNPCLQ